MQSISEDQFRVWSLRIRKGDRSAYTELFDMTYDALLRFSWYITNDQDASNDVLQDVFLKIWQIRHTIDPDRSLRALLFQMVRNISLNHERQKKRRATDALETLNHDPSSEHYSEEDFDTRLLQQHLDKWINAMPERRKEAFILSRFEGLSHDEIARIMNLTPKTVNNHIVLALQYLRERLHSHDMDPSR